MTDKKTNQSDKDYDKWYTIMEACHLLGVSRRTLERRIKQGELKSELREGMRYVYLDINADMSQDQSQLLSQLQNENIRLLSDITDLKQQLREKDEQLKTKDEYIQNELKRKDEQADQARERSDTIIMQLTRQLGDTQKALEAHTKTWWRRLRLGKGKEDGKG